MKEKIIELRKQGLTYSEICNILGCAKSTISYYLNEKTRTDTRRRGREAIYSYISKKTNSFRSRNSITSRIRDKVKSFNQNFNKRNNSNLTPAFGYHDVINKFGIETNCYLTGRPINLLLDKYHFDHIIPVSRNGTNSIENLAIACGEANMAKHNLGVAEFLLLCKEILEYNGYDVIKHNPSLH